jgi:RimJ/RimL family protein N-acetyltransferase
MDCPTLRTAHLLLRLVHMSDLADFNAIVSDPESMRLWSTDPHPDLGTTAIFLERTVARPAAGIAFIMEFEGTP